MEEFEVQLAKVADVQASREEEVTTLKNVVGVGIGYKSIGGKEITELCMQVYVQRSFQRAIW